MIDKASKGIGLGIGMVGLGIGLKFLSDTTKDIKPRIYRPYKPKIPKFKSYRFKY